MTHIDPDEQKLTATFGEHLMTYAVGGLDDLVHCFAKTIHKSQSVGTEYPVVVPPPATRHYMMFKRNLIDAGFTRGKRLVVPVGQISRS